MKIKNEVNELEKNELENKIEKLSLRCVNNPMISAGDIHGVFVKQILLDRKRYNNNFSLMLLNYLEKLSLNGSISKLEAEELGKLPEIICGKKEDNIHAIREIHQKFVGCNGSLTAIAISSIALDSILANVKAIDVEGDIVGAVVGGLIGAVFGNPLIGAVAGAVLLSSAQPAE